MHEYSIIQSLVSSVDAVAVQHPGGIVHHIYVDIGEVSGVDCDLLQTAYETFRSGTVCQDAPITIARIEARWECPDCRVTIKRGAILRCPDCDRPAKLAAGDEILLKRVEMEVA
jgi:hydrogenase nickel incorporation protein HypA/HybF